MPPLPRALPARGPARNGLLSKRSKRRRRKHKQKWFPIEVFSDGHGNVRCPYLEMWALFLMSKGQRPGR